jgi:hypothetical protein
VVKDLDADLDQDLDLDLDLDLDVDLDLILYPSLKSEHESPIFSKRAFFFFSILPNPGSTLKLKNSPHLLRPHPPSPPFFFRTPQGISKAAKAI